MLGCRMVNGVPRGSPSDKTLGACGPLDFCLGTSLGAPFTTLPPRLFQIMSQFMWRHSWSELVYCCCLLNGNPCDRGISLPKYSPSTRPQLLGLPRILGAHLWLPSDCSRGRRRPPYGPGWRQDRRAARHCRRSRVGWTCINIPNNYTTTSLKGSICFTVTIFLITYTYIVCECDAPEWREG